MRRRMKNIDLLKKNVNGVEKSFLIKDGKIMECDFDQEKLNFISKSIQFLAESFIESKRDLQKITIVADSRCIIFFHDEYVLGIVAVKETNFPLLNMVSHKILYTIDLSPEKTEEVIDEVLQRMEAFIK